MAIKKPEIARHISATVLLCRPILSHPPPVTYLIIRLQSVALKWANQWMIRSTSWLHVHLFPVCAAESVLIIHTWHTFIQVDPGRQLNKTLANGICVSSIFHNLYGSHINVPVFLHLVSKKIIELYYQVQKSFCSRYMIEVFIYYIYNI